MGPSALETGDITLLVAKWDPSVPVATQLNASFGSQETHVLANTDDPRSARARSVSGSREEVDTRCNDGAIVPTLPCASHTLMVSDPERPSTKMRLSVPLSINPIPANALTRCGSRRRRRQMWNRFHR
jgi:hypothetical protein